MNKHRNKTVMETIWFAEMEPKDLNIPHSSNYNPSNRTETGLTCRTIQDHITL